MKRILFLIIIVCSISACGKAQKPALVGTSVKIIQPPPERVLVADETDVVASGKTSFRIITSNDSIAHWFMRRFENHGMTKFTYILKKDRRGGYWERSFYFKNDMWNAVSMFINNKFR